MKVKLDQQQKEGRTVLAKCYTKLGLETMAYDIKREEDYTLLEVYAKCVVDLLIRDNLLPELDDLLDTGIVRDI